MNIINETFAVYRMSTVIAIIGGTGLDDPEIVANRQELEDIEDTPWGEPSTIFKGEVNGENVFILSRHGRLHNKSPSQGTVFRLMKQQR